MQDAQLAPPACRGQVVQDEEIREGIGHLGVAVHHPRGPGVQVGEQILRVALGGVHLFKAGKGFPGHEQIHVVIPGNKALVTHCAQQGTAHEVVGYIMGVAYPHNVVKLAHQLLMDYVNGIMRLGHGRASSVCFTSSSARRAMATSSMP